MTAMMTVFSIKQFPQRLAKFVRQGVVGKNRKKGLSKCQIPGQGAVPSGALYTELTAVTRRAFVPRLFVQIYFATPTLFYLMGMAQKSAGGLSQITIPVQGQSMVQGQFTGYSGGFNAPVITPGVQIAQFPTAYWVVPVPLPFGETVLQATDREISLLKARMNDVFSVTVQNMGSLVFSNNSGNSLLPNSFYDGFDNGTNVATYGGINRNSQGNSFWQGQYYSAAGTTVASPASRARRCRIISFRSPIRLAAKCRHSRSMNPGDFATLNNDFIGPSRFSRGRAPNMACRRRCDRPSRI